MPDVEIANLFEGHAILPGEILYKRGQLRLKVIPISRSIHDTIFRTIRFVTSATDRDAFIAHPPYTDSHFTLFIYDVGRYFIFRRISIHFEITAGSFRAWLYGSRVGGLSLSQPYGFPPGSFLFQRQ